MEEDRLAQVELKQKQFFDRLSLLEKNFKPKKDIWDIMSASTPLISGILISGIGLYFAYSNNAAQLKLQETQTIERFFPHLNGTEQEKKAAILAISSLTNTETAAKYAELFPSAGTASALKTIASSGSVQAHDKDVANKALANTFHKMADDYQSTQNTSQAAQAYQQSIDVQSKLVGVESPQLIDSLEHLAEAYKADRNYPLAETTLRRILKIEKDNSGTGDPQYIDNLNKLAAVFKLEGKNDAADHIIEYASLLAQQKAPDDIQTTTSSVSAIKETFGTASSANQNQTVTNIVTTPSSGQANNPSSIPLVPLEVNQKTITTKAASVPAESAPKSAASSQTNATM